MNVAVLKERNSKYYCSNCLMGWQNNAAECQFCGAVFSNYEEVALQLYRLREEYNDNGRI